MDLGAKIRSIPDFPKPGIIFKDITTLVGDGPALREAAAQMMAPFAGESIHAVIGIEARGFILAGIIAHQLGVGMIPVRKKGKLPYHTLGESYALEYGTDTLEIHTDAVQPGEAILIVDDLLATGGTVAAAARLVERLGGRVVGCSFLVELDFLHGRSHLHPMRIESLLHVASE